ncbi:MAG TPA: RNA polymerase sigma factor region1.1 domain-containing protein, partial [Tepidisphaeraceae bacterium]|nr:RNA polymerase sigma factor region1.1 domain-containing protein [Tepidisphaeraceae bacterium]
MKEASNYSDTHLIGSGTPEEAQRRVNVLLEMGTTRGYITYEELNTKLPDEVVSPDKLDSLLMTIDEMHIKLIDDADVADFKARNKGKLLTSGVVPGLAIASLAKIAPLKPAKPVLATPAAKQVPEKTPVVEPELAPEVEDPAAAVDEPTEAEVAEVDLTELEKELAEVSTKRIDDP